jgi:hypothetical protein
MAFWRPGVPTPKKHTFSRNEWLFDLAAEGGKANEPLVSGTVAVFGALVPQASKKPFG